MADFLDSWAQNPYVMLGASMLAGSDPRGEGFGGIGRGVLGAVSQRDDVEDRRRAKLMADMQLQQLQGGMERAEQGRQWMSEHPVLKDYIYAPGNVQNAVTNSLYSTPEMTTDAKNLVAAGYERGTPEFQQQMRERLRQSSFSMQVDPITGQPYILDTRQGRLMPAQLGGYPPQPQSTGVGLPPGAGTNLPGAGLPPPQQEEPVQGPTRSLQAALKMMPSSEQARFQAIYDARNKIPEILQTVADNPDAFAQGRSMSEYAPEGGVLETAAKLYDERTQQNMTPEQRQAYASVHTEAARVIKALAGSAVSKQESAKIERFMPGPNDTVEVIIDKLKQAYKTAGSEAKSFKQLYNADAGKFAELPDYQIKPKQTMSPVNAAEQAVRDMLDLSGQNEQGWQTNPETGGQFRVVR